MFGRRGIIILERILEKAAKVAQDAEVFHLEQVSTPVNFEANRLKSIETRETTGVALRIFLDGRVGFSSTTNLQDLDGLINTAVDTAPFGAEAHFQLPGPQIYPEVPVYDSAVGQTSYEEMIRVGQGVVDGVRSEFGEVQVEGGINRAVQTVSLMNTRSAQFQYTKTVYSMGFEGTLIRDTDMLFVFDVMSSCHPISDGSELITGMLTQLERAKETVSIQSGTMPVLFTPAAVGGALLSPLSAGLNGKWVLQGTSPLVEKLGEKIVDSRFTLVDDPTIPFIPGSRLADDEGSPSRRLSLIENGLLQTFFYDLQTAGKAGVVGTASANRGLTSLPSPSMSVITIKDGLESFESLLATMGNGLVVERLLGAGQSNILGGDFNANVLLGYKVEDGQITGRVKDCMVAGNVYDALNRLIGIGSQARWMGGSLYAPPIVCEGIAVSTKS